MNMSGMEHKESISYDKKNCLRCGKLLPKSTEEEYCPSCKEAMLFDEVRDFIRENNVTEREVAEYFHLPKEKVKAWIRDGRVEYRNNRTL